MICQVLIVKGLYILVHFPRHISRRKTVPTHGTLIAPNYPTSHYRVYVTCNILTLMTYNIVCGEMRNVGSFTYD
jgi:hypothetical protein